MHRTVIIGSDDACVAGSERTISVVHVDSTLAAANELVLLIKI